MRTLSAVVLGAMATVVLGCGDCQKPAKDASSARTDETSAEVKGERGTTDEDSAGEEAWDKANEANEEEYNQIDQDQSDMIESEEGYLP